MTEIEGSLPTFIAEEEQREMMRFGADGSISHTGNVGEPTHIMRIQHSPLEEFLILPPAWRTQAFLKGYKPSSQRKASCILRQSQIRLQVMNRRPASCHASKMGIPLQRSTEQLEQSHTVKFPHSRPSTSLPLPSTLPRHHQAEEAKQRPALPWKTPR